jgi:CBS domain-containing protein
LVKVGDIMTKDLPHIDVSANVLDAFKVMSRSHKMWTGVVVLQSRKPIGMLTERSILRRFIGLNKKPEDVKVQDVMAPLLRISADAPVSEAIKKMVNFSFTRLGVFDGEKLLGWVSLTDVARQSSKHSIVDVLFHQNLLTSDDELLCQSCRSGIMDKVRGSDGQILRWECPNCHHVQ